MDGVPTIAGQSGFNFIQFRFNLSALNVERYVFLRVRALLYGYGDLYYRRAGRLQGRFCRIQPRKSS